VAWPGVQPSPLAGSEASTAQKPQPQPEVTPKTTLRTSPITTLGVEVSDEENSAADTDYAADMAAAQSLGSLAYSCTRYPSASPGCSLLTSGRAHNSTRGAMTGLPFIFLLLIHFMFNLCF